MRRFFDILSFLLLCGFSGVYTVACFTPFSQSNSDVWRLFIVRLETLTFLEGWPVIMFFVSFTLLYNSVPFLLVLIVMLISGEVYRQAPG